MAKCPKCGAEVPEEEMYEAGGQMVCEDCKIKLMPSPSKPCGGEK